MCKECVLVVMSTSVTLTIEKDGAAFKSVVGERLRIGVKTGGDSISKILTDPDEEERERIPDS